jgi:hypothetical protein
MSSLGEIWTMLHDPGLQRPRDYLFVVELWKTANIQLRKEPKNPHMLIRKIDAGYRVQNAPLAFWMRNHEPLPRLL